MLTELRGGRPNRFFPFANVDGTQHGTHVSEIWVLIGFKKLVGFGLGIIYHLRKGLNGRIGNTFRI